MYKRYIKRLMDILFSIILLIILLPLSLVIGLLCLFSTKHIFYKQKRNGLYKKSFWMYKFSTMKEIDGTYEERTPLVMRVIRAIGLNEIPQLVNILKGDMSFVGPRPFMTGEKLPIYPNEIFYTVKPGVVSLAVAHGKRFVSHEKRLEYDEEYAKKVSFKLDIIILFKSLKVLITQNTGGESWKK